MLASFANKVLYNFILNSSLQDFPVNAGVRHGFMYGPTFLCYKFMIFLIMLFVMLLYMLMVLPSNLIILFLIFRNN